MIILFVRHTCVSVIATAITLALTCGSSFVMSQAISEEQWILGCIGNIRTVKSLSDAAPANYEYKERMLEWVGVGQEDIAVFSSPLLSREVCSDYYTIAKEWTNTKRIASVTRRRGTPQESREVIEAEFYFPTLKEFSKLPGDFYRGMQVNNPPAQQGNDIPISDLRPLGVVLQKRETGEDRYAKVECRVQYVLMPESKPRKQISANMGLNSELSGGLEMHSAGYAVFEQGTWGLLNVTIENSLNGEIEGPFTNWPGSVGRYGIFEAFLKAYSAFDEALDSRTLESELMKLGLVKFKVERNLDRSTSRNFALDECQAALKETRKNLVIRKKTSS